MVLIIKGDSLEWLLRCHREDLGERVSDGYLLERLRSQELQEPEAWRIMGRSSVHAGG